MTSTEIIENNRKIGKYMGIYPVYWQINTVDDVHYHTSERWIGEVIEKIHEQGYRMSASRPNVKVWDGDQLIADVRDPDFQKATYKAVVAFIDWYNENKKG